MSDAAFDRPRHPRFAWLWPRIARRLDRDAATRRIRAELAAEAHGAVVEVGCGVGSMFRHYPADAEVLAVEPEPGLRVEAGAAAEAAMRAMPGLRIRVVPGDAEHLPVDDAAADVVLASLVLCSVPDQPAALAEIRRVLRPGGSLLAYEHVRSSRGWAARLQSGVTPLWRLGAGGCRLDRDTEAAIERAGFRVVDRRPTGSEGAALVPHVSLTAR